MLELLAGAPAGLPTPELAERGFGSDTIARLAKQVLVSLRQDRVDRDPFAAQTFEATAVEAGRRLTGEQAARSSGSPPSPTRASSALRFCTASPAAERRNCTCGSRPAFEAAGGRH